MNKKLFQKVLISNLLVLAFSATAVMGYTADLKDKEIKAAGRKSKSFMILKNEEGKPIALEVVPKWRRIDITGEERTEPIEEEMFLIYPNQLVLNSGEEEIVNFVYTGDSKIKEELAFRLVVRQIPLPTPDTETGSDHAGKIEFLTQYEKALFVEPKKAESRPTLLRPEVITKENKEHVRLTIQNRGNKHISIKNIFFKLTSADKDTQTYDFENVGTAIILANSSMIFEYELPVELSDGQKLSADYTFDVNF